MSLGGHDHDMVKKAVDSRTQRSDAFQGLRILLPGAQSLDRRRDLYRLCVQVLLSGLGKVFGNDRAGNGVAVVVLLFFGLAKDVLNALKRGGDSKQIV